MKRMLMLLVAMGLSGLALPGSAVAAVSAGNKNVSQSYYSAGSIRPGTIVSLASGSSDTVEPVDTSNAQRLVGVAVARDDSLVAVNPDPAKTQVASSGTAVVLVSTVNGAVTTGDAIAVSPFSGIGMKAGSSGGYIVGRAQEAFNAHSETAATQQVTDRGGKKQTISVGYVPVTIAPGFMAASNSGGVQQAGIQKFVRSLTGHTVSMPRIIASLVIASLTIVTIIVLIYASIYGSLISIGRNPLARNSVLQALTLVFMLAAFATFMAFILVFFLLR